MIPPAFAVLLLLLLLCECRVRACCRWQVLAPLLLLTTGTLVGR